MLKYTKDNIKLIFVGGCVMAIDTVNRSEILLESGTNEMEIMEFKICDEVFGINVAKVREIMMPTAIKPMPHSHPAIEGVYKPRDIVITVVNLPKYLDFPAPDGEQRELFIVTNFNKLNIAFRVHAVVGIDRISWEKIQKPDKTIYGGCDGVVTGIAEFEGRLITILDFEKIISDIAPETGIQMSEIDKLGHRERDERPILIAEDSVLLAKMITEALHKAGYVNTILYTNGQEAWDHLEAVKDEPDLRERVACIITDIEMPLMDGHRLTKLTKEHPKLRNIPLIIFSSLINDEMHIKGRQLGADEQLSKPEIGHLVETIDALINRFEDDGK